jgi:CDP-paratose 2-epimerase
VPDKYGRKLNCAFSRGESVRILISGGAGFIGSTIARSFQEKSCNQVVVLDNLRRRGSELNLLSFKKMGVEFHHGDVREPDDLLDVPGNFDLMIEASAEPSVQAGQQGSPAYVIGTNLQGTINCLEYARKKAGLFAYLSTSRVYSISSLRAIQLDETPQRFEVAAQQILPGISERGIDESFPTNKPRSLYGATKLASELLIQEYVDSYGIKAIVNRCGVIAGPGQFGKTDQGVISLWVANHCFGLPLNYKGFGGKGKQVRDVLHPLDLVALLSKQIEKPGYWDGEQFNIGGGRLISVSLLELTDLCREIVGSSVAIGSTENTERVDVPLYLTDYSKAQRCFDWRPQRDIETIVSEIAGWVRSNEDALRPIFAPETM